MSPHLEPILTHHARARMQQRGIPADAVEELLCYGSEHHVRHGAVILCLDRAARRRLVRDTGRRHAGNERLRNLYVVESVGVIATVGHRTRRLRRH